MLQASLHAVQLPAGQQAVLACLQERCLASADAAVQQRVLQQLRVAAQHLQALASALLLQQQLTGLDPRLPEAKQQAALAAGFAQDDVEQQAPDDDVDADRAPLTPEAERLLQAAFALADVLDGSQVSGLAFLARCSEQQLRNHFSRLRTSVRSAVQRAQKRAHGSSSSTGKGAAVIPASSDVQPSYPPPPSTSTPSVPPPHHPQQQGGSGAPEQLQGLALALQQQQEAALQRTQQLLDPAGLVTMSCAGSFVAAMQQTASYTARRRQLAALCATGVSTLTRLCTSKVLDILQAWLQEGLAEQQLSFVRQVLHTLRHVPINTALLHSSTLLQTVQDMAKRGPVAASATQVVRKWGQQQEQSTWDGLQPLLLGVQPLGSGAAAKAPGARQQEGGVLGMRPLGGPSLAAQRSLSAAVKRKVQEMKAGGAVQPSVAAAGGGGGGDAAPRAPSSSAQQQQQSSLQRQASAVGGASTAGAGIAAGASGSSTAAAAAAAGFKRPSKVARTLAGGGQPSAAAQRAALVQRQLSGAAAGASGAAASSALAAAAGGAGSAGSGARPAGQVRVSKPADLTPGQRLYRMQVKPVDQQLLQRMAAPGSAATASQLAQGLMSYNRALQLWLAARCRRVGLEARIAAQLSVQRQQQRQQAAAGFGMVAAAAGAGVAVATPGGPTEPWVQPPAVVWSTELDGQVASGQDSQDAGNHQLAAATASSAYGVLSPDEDSPAEPSDDAGVGDTSQDMAGAPTGADEGHAGGGSVPVVIPWQPVDSQTAAAAACRVWSAGVRVPHCYQLPLPSAQDVARYEAEQQAAKAQAAQPQGMPGAPAPGQLVHPQYTTVPQYGLPAQPVQQQQQPAGLMVQMVPGQVVQAGGYAVAQHHPPVQQVVQVVYPPGYVAAPAGYMPYVPQYPPGYQ